MKTEREAKTDDEHKTGEGVESRLHIYGYLNNEYSATTTKGAICSVH